MVRDLCAVRGNIVSTIFFSCDTEILYTKVGNHQWTFQLQWYLAVFPWDVAYNNCARLCINFGYDWLHFSKSAACQSAEICYFSIFHHFQPWSGYNTAAKVLKLCTNVLINKLIIHTNFQPVWPSAFLALGIAPQATFLIFSICMDLNTCCSEFQLVFGGGGGEVKWFPYCWDPKFWE